MSRLEGRKSPLARALVGVLLLLIFLLALYLVAHPRASTPARAVDAGAAPGTGGHPLP